MSSTPLWRTRPLLPPSALPWKLRYAMDIRRTTAETQSKRLNSTVLELIELIHSKAHLPCCY